MFFLFKALSFSEPNNLIIFTDKYIYMATTDRLYSVLVSILILSMVSLSSCKTKQVAFSSNADEYVEEEESFVDSVTGEINYYNSMT